jgi:hypothetical protein
MNTFIDNVQDDDDIVIDEIHYQKKDVHKYKQSDNAEDMEDDENSESDVTYLEQEMNEL